MKFRFLSPAQWELTTAIRYYDQQRVGLGWNFYLEVQAAVQRMQQFPEAYPALGEGFRRCLVKRFPYSVMYTLRDNSILIVAVAHQRREPDYWRGRTHD